MMRDTSRLAVHTITTKPWPIETAVDVYHPMRREWKSFRIVTGPWNRTIFSAWL